ncbi:hypothetical protein ILYODFUR_020797 [Ilyodon furcidens]|uniref:Uncharacterized protein n=1 Tax=Ilyodon furcidens TaxID=33524 RepID=A0ABV0U8V4_9TELE
MQELLLHLCHVCIFPTLLEPTDFPAFLFEMMLVLDSVILFTGIKLVLKEIVSRNTLDLNLGRTISDESSTKCSGDNKGQKFQGQQPFFFAFNSSIANTAKTVK